MRDDAGGWIIDHLADAFIYPKVYDKAAKTGKPELAKGEFDVAMFARAPASQSVKKNKNAFMLARRLLLKLRTRTMKRSIRSNQCQNKLK